MDANPTLRPLATRHGCGGLVSLKCAEFCIINTLTRGSREHVLRFKPYISRIIHRVTLFVGLRGSLADDQTARMLHVLLATLAVWMAAGGSPRYRSLRVSFPRIFNPARPGSELRHCTRAAPARPLPARQSGLPRRHLDLGDARLLFLRRCTQPGSAALRVLASLGGLAPRIPQPP